MNNFSISGGELFERIVADDYVLTEHECILFLRQICEGISYMHKKRVRYDRYDSYLTVYDCHIK